MIAHLGTSKQTKNSSFVCFICTAGKLVNSYQEATYQHMLQRQFRKAQPVDRRLCTAALFGCHRSGHPFKGSFCFQRDTTFEEIVAWNQSELESSCQSSYYYHKAVCCLRKRCCRKIEGVCAFCHNCYCQKFTYILVRNEYVGETGY